MPIAPLPASLLRTRKGDRELRRWPDIQGEQSTRGRFVETLCRCREAGAGLIDAIRKWMEKGPVLAEKFPSFARPGRRWRKGRRIMEYMEGGSSCATSIAQNPAWIGRFLCRPKPGVRAENSARTGCVSQTCCSASLPSACPPPACSLPVRFSSHAPGCLFLPPGCRSRCSYSRSAPGTTSRKCWGRASCCFRPRLCGHAGHIPCKQSSLRPRGQPPSGAGSRTGYAFVCGAERIAIPRKHSPQMRPRRGMRHNSPPIGLRQGFPAALLPQAVVRKRQAHSRPLPRQLRRRAERCRVHKARPRLPRAFPPVPRTPPTLRRAMPLCVRSTPFACALPRRSAWVGCHPGFPRMPPARRPSSSRRHWARGCCSGQGCSAPAKQRRDGMPPRNSPCIQRHIVSAVRHDGAFPHSPPHIQTHAIAATRHGSAAPRSSPRIRRHLSAAARRCWALCSPVSPRGARSPSISPGGAGCHWASSAACCLAQPARRCTARCARNRPPCAPFAAWPCSWAGRSPACSETPGIRLQLPSARRCSPCWRSGYARRLPAAGASPFPRPVVG